jgi:hypothetical protein
MPILWNTRELLKTKKDLETLISWLTSLRRRPSHSSSPWQNSSLLPKHGELDLLYQAKRRGLREKLVPIQLSND